jgi:hypothetical protein
VLAEPEPGDGGVWVPAHLPYVAPLLPAWAGRTLEELLVEVGGLFLSQEVGGQTRAGGLAGRQARRQAGWQDGSQAARE